jgi:hypothetical protein
MGVGIDQAGYQGEPGKIDRAHATRFDPISAVYGKDAISLDPNDDVAKQLAAAHIQDLRGPN